MAEQTATFAGGCFWCMQPPFDNTKGVIQTRVGYTGGDEENAKYRMVASGATGHYEAVEVVFDPEQVSFQTLLDVFWRNINPVQGDGQFADRGPQYRTAVFYHSDHQRDEALASRGRLQSSGAFEGGIETEILPVKPFYPAEEEHQGYYQKNAAHYEQYKEGSGRGPFLRRTWKQAG